MGSAVAATGTGLNDVWCCWKFVVLVVVMLVDLFSSKNMQTKICEFLYFIFAGGSNEVHVSCGS